MSKASEHHVFFAVFGFGDDPSVVTELMGVEPTKAWAKGDLRPNRPNAAWDHGRWTLQSRLDLTERVEAHLLDLLPRLEERHEAVSDVTRRYETVLQVACYFREVNPGFDFPIELVRRLGTLGVDLDFDLYCLGSDDAE